MSFALKQSTAVVVPFGPFVDKTDGVTLETGLVSALDHASTGILLSKNGGTLTIRHATVTASAYDAHGCYKVTLDTTDTNTLGTLRMIYTDAATCLPAWMDFMVLPANVWDSLYGSDKLDVNVAQISEDTTAADTLESYTDGTTPIPANVTQIGGGAQSATDLKDFADDGYDPATNKVQGVVLVDTLTTYTGNTPQTGDSFARLGAPAGASVSADIAAIEAQTDDIGAAGAGLSAVPWNAAWDAEVQSEVQDAIEANHLDHLIASADPGGVVANSSFLAKLASKSATPAFSSFDNTTDSLEAIRDKEADIETDTQDLQSRTPAALVSGRMDSSVGAMAADVVTAAAIAANAIGASELAADAVTEIQSGLATAASIAALNNLSAAQVNSECDTALSDAGVTSARQAKLDQIPEGPAQNAEFTYTFKMVDETDGYTPETGLTITATRSIAGAAFGSATGTVTEIGGGTYKFVASAADMNGTVVTHRFAATGARTLEIVIQTTA